MRMKPPSLAPMERPAYRPDLRRRLLDERAAKTEPKLRPVTSPVFPRNRWEYDPERCQ